MTPETATTAVQEMMADRILAKKEDHGPAMKSGLYLPGQDGKGTPIALVVAAGPGRQAPDGTLIPNTIHVGDRVMFDPMQTAVAELDDEEFVIFREPFVIAKLPPAPEVEEEPTEA